MKTGVFTGLSHTWLPIIFHITGHCVFFVVLAMRFLGINLSEQVWTQAYSFQRLVTATSATAGPSLRLIYY